ncbi:hypothetical protein BH09VER1_BH09VER1_33230 [soil metagenome]
MALALHTLPGWLIEATLQGSLAILLVWLIVPWVRRGLGAQAAYILWGLVLLRLLVPWQPGSPFEWGITLPEIREVESSGLKLSVTTETDEPEPTAKAGGEAPTIRKAPWRVDFWGWMAGVIVIVGFSIVRSWRASRLAGRAQEISGDPKLRAILQSWPMARSRIRETGELRSPALTGLWRPVILLPLDWRERLTDEQLGCVLAHEAGHHHRRDLLWRWAFLMARALHWFNPLVWLAERAARTDQEMACDEWVLRHNRVASPERYGEALLVSAQRLAGARVGFTVQADMAESRVGLRRRILYLARIRPRGWLALVAGVLLTGLLLMVTGPVRSDQSAPGSEPVKRAAAEVLQPPSTTLAEPAKEETPVANTETKGSNVLIEVKILEIPPELVSTSLGTDKSQDGSIAVRAIYNNEEFQQFLRGLNEKKEVDLMSAPSVTTRSGQRSTIQIVREFRYPTEFQQAGRDSLGAGVRIPLTPTAFETKPIGVTLECEPKARKDGTIDLSISSRVVEFEGFVDFAGSRAAKSDLKEDPLIDTYEPAAEGGTIRQPIFASREMTNKIALRSGETTVLGGITSDFRKVADSLEASSAKEPAKKQVLFIFVTATVVRADGQKREGGAAKTSVSPGRDGERFYGVPVPGKPGFVTSPYATEAGYIDVRGFTVGAEVKDPYTGQMFLVPSADGSISGGTEPDPKSPLGKASRIIIPSVEFKNATISKALNILKEKSVELDSQAGGGGVNLVLKISPSEEFNKSHRISAVLTNISVLEALKQVAESAGLFLGDERWAIAIKSENPLVFSTRVYRVPRTFLADLQKADAKTVKKYWEALGIQFPDGASASFLPPTRLVFHNTMDEHSKLSTLFMAQQDEDGVRPRVVVANAEDPEASPLRPSLTPQAAKAKQEYKISRVETRETTKGGRVVTETIAHLAKTPALTMDLKLAAYFYERTKEGQVQLVKAGAAPEWISPPANWKNSDSEKLELRYEPESDERTYEGCVLALYFQGVLEDVWSSSEELRKKFPLEPMM